MKGVLYILIIIVFLIQLTTESFCGSYIPYRASTCHQYSNTSTICCFLRGNFDGNYHSMCYPFSRELYYKMGRSVKVNGYSFDLDCGERRGALCGDVVNPITYKDCGIYSTKSNSCCFYQYKYKLSERDTDWITDTNCVWLGTPDVGQINYRKLTVMCFGEKLYFSKFLILFFISLLLM